MKAAKCTSCGANIEIDESKEISVCPFCKTSIITEKAIQGNTTNNNANVINNYYGGGSTQNTTIKVPRTERPKLNVGLAILGFFFYIFPGVLYVAHIKKKQKEWDDKYTY
ncbi:MAG: hypothetical protein IJ538_01285 [Clostridia bacterium]|nr:hypothetical protein [Clostridia bacterium]